MLRRISGQADCAETIALRAGVKILFKNDGHLADVESAHDPQAQEFEVVLDVTEPMDMETLVYFSVDGASVCARVSPDAGATAGRPLRLVLAPK